MKDIRHFAAMPCDRHGGMFRCDMPSDVYTVAGMILCPECADIERNGGGPSAMVSLLKSAVSSFENGRTVVDGFPSALSQTGEEYTKIVNGAVVSEGSLCPTSSSPEDAIQAWLTGIVKWAEDKPGTIYWRSRPELESIGDGRWKVYSRLLISDKLVAAKIAEERIRIAKETGKIKFSSGHTAGLSPVCEMADDIGTAFYDSEGMVMPTPEDLTEFADVMIDRWQRFKALLERKSE